MRRKTGNENEIDYGNYACQLLLLLPYCLVFLVLVFLVTMILEPCDLCVYPHTQV